MPIARYLSVGLSLCLMVAAVLAPHSGAQVAAVPELTLTEGQLLEIARVDAPPAGTGLQIHADFPEEHPLLLDGLTIYALTADITPEGAVVVRSAVTDEGHDSGLEQQSDCNDPTFRPLGVLWDADDMPVKWRFNIRTAPEKLKDRLTIRSARRAHRVWPRAKTNCNNPDANEFRFWFTGLIRKHVKFDGVNIVEFGGLGSGALAVNYTWYRGTKITEVDLRLNRYDYPWTNWIRGGRWSYQVMNVVTHELGHQLGLDDLSEPHGALTMYGRIGKGEISKITLGRGDLKGAATLSP
ncbi:MAG: hypothetical protein ACRDKB_03760 [Actinomycetota bacterium]